MYILNIHIYVIQTNFKRGHELEREQKRTRGKKHRKVEGSKGNREIM